MRHLALATSVALALSAVACRAPDEGSVLESAAEALGAANLDSIQYSGSGSNNAFGQAYEPGGPWPEFKLTRYTAAINYTAPAMRVELDRTNPDGVIRGGGGLPLLAPQRQVQVVSGEFGWNVAGGTANPAQAATAERQRAIWMSPHGVVRAAMNAGEAASVTTETTSDGRGRSVISYPNPADGSPMRATVNADHLVERVETVIADPWIGDVPVVVTYSDYRDFNGVQFPMRIAQTQGGFPTLTLTISDVQPNASVNIEVPANVREAPLTVPTTLVQTEIADGVYHITGAFLQSAAVEFEDHILLIDPGQDEARAREVFDGIKQTIPNKPVRYVLSTHHHFDHLGGIRYAIAEGTTIITQTGTRAFYEKALAMPHTVRPDRLAREPRAAVFETVDDMRVMTDGKRQLVIHRMQNFSHCETLLMAYLPTEKVLIQTDSYNTPAATAPPPPSVSPLWATLYDNIQRLKLDVVQIAPGHGRLVTIDDLRKAVGR